MLLNILVTILFYVGMEFAAWATHKYVMHGFMWYFHKDHHQKEDHWWERNDVFFLIFATPGILSMIFGALHEFAWYFYAGLGITLYGFTYFLVHDVFIHQRIKLFRDTKSVYFMALRRAHKAHHKVLTKEKGVCFGMLVVPKRYWDEARQLLQKV